MKPTATKALQQTREGIHLTVEELGLISPTNRSSTKLKIGTDALRKATNFTKELLFPSMTLSDTLSPTRDQQALT